MRDEVDGGNQLHLRFSTLEPAQPASCSLKPAQPASCSLKPAQPASCSLYTHP